MNRIQIHDKHFEPYLSPEVLQERVNALGQAITADYEGKEPLLIAVLNGSFMFAADLFRAVRIPASISFVKLASYEGMASSGTVLESIGLSEAIRNRHLVVLEDIIDTGRTLHHFIAQLQQQEPASISIATLLLKPSNIQFPQLPVTYTGFSIPDKFVVGYGLDYDGLGRNLPGIYQLSGSH
jgi:hypoxanthine phosphoribosyltransferase